jgi:hypothetical protein
MSVPRVFTKSETKKITTFYVEFSNGEVSLLRPCPFCDSVDGPPDVIYENEDEGFEPYYSIHCDDCCLQKTYPFGMEAADVISRWNSRR